MIKLYDSQITDILPEILSEKPEIQALSHAINKAMQRLINYCQNISVYAAIDTQPEDVLDLLAVELNTPYYDDSMDIEVKRNLIKNTLIWYLKAGTPAAVEEAVTAVFGNGEVKEWFDYGGEPYHFQITTSNINSTDEMIQQLTEIISKMKNARSYLDEVTVDILQKLYLFNGCSIEAVADCVTIGIDMNI